MKHSFLIRAFVFCLVEFMATDRALAQCSSSAGDLPKAIHLEFSSETFSASLVGFGELANPSNPPRYYRRKTIMGDQTYHIYGPSDGCRDPFLGDYKGVFDLTCQYDASSGALTTVNNSLIDYYKNAGPVPLNVSCSSDFGGIVTPTTAVAQFGTGECSPYGWYDGGYHSVSRTGTVTTQLEDEDKEADAEKRAVKTQGSSSTAFRTSRTARSFSACKVHYKATFAVLCDGEYDAIVTYSIKPHGSITVTGRDMQVVRKTLKTGEHTISGDIRVAKADTDYTIDSIELRKPCDKVPPGEADFRVDSVHVQLSLGLGAGQESAGFLDLKADGITPAIYAPASLTVATADQGTETIRDVAGALRQVKAPQALVDIVTLGASSYEIRFYSSLQVGTQDPGTKIYAINGTPYAVFKFENPDTGQATRLRITESRSAITRVSEYAFDSGANAWALIRGNGLRKESLTITIVGADTTKVSTIRDGNDTIVSKTSKIRRTFAWGEELISEVLDPDGAALTTTYQFYSDAATDGGAYRHLKQRTGSDGSWERYTYDASGRPLKITRPFLDAVVTAADSLCRVTENSYSTLVDADGDNVAEQLITTIETTLGLETGRSYRIDWSKSVTLSGDVCTRRSDIRCVAAGAAWDASSNLVTETLAYAEGPFADRTRRTVNPDGTATLVSYALDSGGQLTTTRKSGAPNSAKDDIADGTRTVAFTNAQGQETGESVTDIASANVLSSWTATQFDGLGRPTRLDYTDGTYVTRDYACCGLSSERDRSGVTTSYAYDDLGRQKSVTRSGISTETAYDADGRVKSITRRGTDNSTMVMQSNSYDLAGRITERRDALNRATRYAETYDSGTGHTTRTTTNPDTGTSIEVSARDGSRLSVSGTAVAPQAFEYGVDAADGAFTKEIRVGDNGATAEWNKTFVDVAGRSYKTVLADNAATTAYFNAVGQLARQVDPDGVTTLFAYNARGEREVTAVDLNRNNAIDFAGTDRVTKTVTDVTAHSGVTVQRATTQVWETDDQNTPTTVSVSEAGSDGLHSWQTVRGLTTSTVTTLDGSGGRTVTTTTPDGVKSIQIYAGDQLASTTVRSGADVQLTSVTYGYDPHGRLQTSTDARNGATSYAYYGDDQIHTVTTPDPDVSRSGDGYDPQTTTYTYDPAGRVDTVTQPDGGVVHTTYWPTGAVKRTWGSRTYPVEYTYDPQGRVKTLTTWQNFAGNSGQAVTTWNYDAVRGWLNNKRYADNTGPGYTYKPSGRLLTRVWARTPTITTTYAYNAAGDLSGIDYSDATPDVTMGYDRAGRPNTTTDASGTRTMAYHASGQLQDEIYTAGALSGLAVGRTFDSLFRLAGLSALNSQPSTLNSVSYSYDAASRLDTVTQGTNTATYGYVTNSPLVGAIVFQQGGTTRLSTTKSYDNLNRLTSIVSTPSAGSAMGYAYDYNSANQRTKATRENGAYWNYGYDALGQVTSGKKFDATAAGVLGHDFAWTYDDIGTRKTATANGNASTYMANNLNQYSQRTVPGVMEVLGEAQSNATVSTTFPAGNGTISRPTRQGSLFYQQLSVSNSSASQYPTVKITGVKNGIGSNGEDAVTEVTRSTLVAATPEIFTCDADGNLTDDARWHYTWDGENRLIEMQTSTAAATAGLPRQRLEFAYDGQGRRFSKKVSNWSGSTWTLVTSTRFLYDNWNLLADLNALNSNAVICTYAWGLDLSGSFQGAGGVGGLLLSAFNAQPSAHAAAYDGNGNVIAYVDTATGVKSTTYEYGAFGEKLSADGPMTEVFTFRFSTKYTDTETDLLYYGLRYYSPTSGRWLSKDPVEEDGGVNLYGFVENNGVNQVDFLGLFDSPFVHGGIMADGLSGNFSDEHIARISAGSNGIDFGDYIRYRLNKPYNLMTHFDGIQNPQQLDANWADVNRRMGELAENIAEQYCASRRTDVNSLLHNYGGILHSVQDFYAHSNFVEQFDGIYDPSNPAQKNVISGITLDTDSVPADRQHGGRKSGMNKDSKKRPQFDRARSAAVEATRQNWQQMREEIRQHHAKLKADGKCCIEIEEILKWFTGR